jgi:hypothetical protein
MSVFDNITDGLNTILETAKDIPTEKIAVVGLIILGAGAIAKDIASGNVGDAIDKAKEVIGMK